MQVALLVTVMGLGSLPGQISQAAPLPADLSRALAGPSGPVCTVLQPNEADSMDAWIKQDKTNENKNDSELRVKTENGKRNHSLLQFDLSSAVPTNAQIASATLSLYVREVRDGNSTVRVRQLLNSWSETGVTWNNRDRFVPIPWVSPGGDYDINLVLDSANFVKGNKDYLVSFDITSAAQAWATNPASNHGVLLEAGVTSPKSEVRFRSSGHSTASQRPMLEICFLKGPSIGDNKLMQGQAGQTRTFAHTITANDFSEIVNLSAVSDQGWTIRFYADVDEDGVKDNDTPITQTPFMPAGSTFGIVVEVDIPDGTPNGTKDIVTITVTGADSATFDSVINYLGVGFTPPAPPVLDGRRDAAYTESLNASVQDYCAAPGQDGAGTVLARTMTLYDVNDPDYVWLVLEMTRAHADNAYGTNQHPSWTEAGKNWTFSAMVGSDKAQVLLRDANNNLIFDVTADYLASGQPTLSGYGSAGVTGGDGSVSVGNPAFVAVESSMGYNMNRFCTGNGQCTVASTNLINTSPAIDINYVPLDPFFNDWEFSYLYEYRFDASAFGTAGFGSATINNVHVSPNKTGKNEIVVVPCGGSIGDRVWFDKNGDGVQDPNEEGINGVQVRLYQDNGSGVFEPEWDIPVRSAFTSGDGDYLFEGLGPGTYWVKVVESTVPDEYLLTTNNDPMLVELGLGENFLDADFGYLTLPDVTLTKTLNSDDPTFVGNEIEFRVTIENTGNTPIDFLPLQDFYDPEVLQFVSAIPAPSNVSNGVITWDDLTTTTGDLAVGQSTSVTLRFLALEPTSMMTRMAAPSAKIVQPRSGILPPSAELSQYLVIAMGNDANIGRAFQMSNTEIGADRRILSISDDPGYVTDGGFPNLLGVFEDRWNTSTNPHSLNDASGLFQGIDWSGEVALTSSNGKFDSSNSLVFADTGIQSVSSSPLASVSNSKYYDVGVVGPSGPNLNVGSGVTVNNNHTDLLAELTQWKSYLMGLDAEASITNQNAWTNNGANNGVGGLYTVYPDSLDTNNDGIIVVDINVGNNDFSVNNTDWIIDGTGNKLIVFRLRNGSNMLISNGSIVMGKGGIGDRPLGVLFLSAYEGSSSSDSVFNFDNVVASGTAFWDLNAVGEGGSSINTEIVINNGQGCAQFISQKVNFQDNRWNRCAPSFANGTIGDRVFYDIDGSGLPDDGVEPGLNGVTVNLYQGACPTGSTGVPFQTTVTSGNGDYLFSSLPEGDYCVNVDESTLPTDLVLTTNNEPHFKSLADGEAYLLADFGYRAEAPNKTCDLVSVNGAVDIYGNMAAARYDDACVEIQPAQGAIGDFVWYDANSDGIQDVGEPGIPNVTLDLYLESDGVPGLDRDSDTLVASTVTDADGGYLFTKLPPGTYYVDVTDENGVLTGFTHIVANQSLPDPTGPIVLDPGQVFKDADFGYVQPPGGGNAVIGDYVWYDANNDGIQQPDEPGIGGVEVCAIPTGGGAPICDVTNGAGYYLVTVPAGTYTVAPTPGQAVLNNLTATTPVPHGPITVQPGDQYLDADFGYWDNNTNLLGTIGNLVFWDNDRDGVYNPGAGDLPLRGVSVDLIKDLNNNGVWDDGEPIIATVTTSGEVDANNGNYLFTGVPAGNYLVHVSDTNAVLTDWIKSPDGNQAADNTSKASPFPVSLPAGGSNLLADFGYFPTSGPETGVIGNQIWIETDGNGIFNPLNGDFGQPGVTVDLYESGSFVAQTTTGASGDYSFVGLPAGDYTVEVSDIYGVLDGYIVTKLGPNPGQDNNNQAQPYTVILPQGGVNLTADFGYIKPAAIGDFVWYDANNDGIQDIFEPGIGNVLLELYLDNGDGVFNAGSDTLIDTLRTDQDGGYLFKPLMPNQPYFVRVAPSNFAPGGALEGLTKTTGPQSQPTPFGPQSVAAGETYRDADFGYVRLEPGKAIIGDFVWYDFDGDGVQDLGEPGIPDIEVCVYDAGTGTTGTPVACDTTDLNGLYQIPVDPGTYVVAPVNPPAGFTATTPVPHGPITVAAGDQYLDADFGYNQPGQLGQIGGTVWNDVNDNGLLEPGEPVLPGVSVTLYRDLDNNGQIDPGDPVFATTITDQDGNYLFTGLPAGNYLVQVTDTQNVLNDYVVSTLGPNPGQDNNNQAQPYAVTLPAGGSNTTADFGYIKPNLNLGSIGNQVWFESDDNGIYNPGSGDVGIAGVTVDLFLNGVFYDRTTTGGSGGYIFTGLPSGNYTVAVSDAFNVLQDAGGSGIDYIPTVPGPNPGQDNNNQAQPYAITLPVGGENLTADFGYRLPDDGDGVTYELTKRLLSAPVVAVNDVVRFSIRITNTSNVVITTLPLTDTFNVLYLDFVDSVPPANSVANGVARWTDLTSFTPNGFSRDLGPGESFEVIVRFQGIGDTTGQQQPPCVAIDATCNVAIVSGAYYDPDGPGGVPPQGPLPPKQDEAPVTILNTTSVGVVAHGAQFGENGITLRWSAGNQHNILGFHLYRVWPDGSTDHLTADGMLEPGQTSYTDNDPHPHAAVDYILEAFDLDGRMATRLTLAQMRSMFLPAVTR